MRRKLFGTKKRIAAVAVTVAVLGGAIGAFAYFSSTGSGTGNATVANPTTVSIHQVGAAYDSLIPLSSVVPSPGGGPYIQDQCFACAKITDLGETVTLAEIGGKAAGTIQRLGNVVVAFRNYGGAFTVPITLSIVNGPSSTVTASVPTSVGATGGRTTFTVTFPFNGQFVPQSFTYDISFNSAAPADGLNVALSSSANQLSIGSNPDPHSIWLKTNPSDPPGSDGDFPSCTTDATPTIFTEITNTNCGPSATQNPGAYGDKVGPNTDDADIPAVEFNVLDGGIVDMSPGVSQPIEFAIINNGTATVHVNQVTTSIASVTGGGVGPGDPCSTGAGNNPFSITGTNPVTVNLTVNPGTTIVTAPSGTQLTFTNSANIQDNCKTATVNLAFTSN